MNIYCSIPRRDGKQKEVGTVVLLTELVMSRVVLCTCLPHV